MKLQRWERMMPCTDVQKKVSPAMFKIAKSDVIIVHGLDHGAQIVLWCATCSYPCTTILSLHHNYILHM